MSQDSILELISVTSNAVKALDRTSSSRSAGSSRRTTPREGHENAPQQTAQDSPHSNRSSSDSGVGQTATQSVPAQIGQDGDAGEDSDHSTTASEVLIRSTCQDDPKRRAGSLNSSSTSQGSRCIEVDNFNVANAKNVKVSKKHLREIVSPRESGDFGGSDRSSGKDNPARNMNSRGIADLNTNNNRCAGRGDYALGKENQGKVINGMNGKIIPGVPFKQNSSLSASSQSKDGKELSSKLVESKNIPYRVERHDGQKQTTIRSPREFPQKADQSQKVTDTKHPPGLYKPVKDVDATKQFGAKTFPVEAEDQQEDWGESESVSSSQPEIITVTERVVNISSQALLPSEEDDSSSVSSAVEKVSEANRPQTFPRAKPPGRGLRQGALSKGSAIVDRRKEDEVQISKFSLTEKQRELREALAKRGNQSKPVRRMVQAKVVDSCTGSETEEGNTNNNMNSESGSNTGGPAPNVESITAAVAASAAVAATQPFLKLQQELENKMQTLLAEMDRIQKGASAGTSGSKAGTADDARRLEQLEQQVQELTERRLQHLETLQHQQMEMQAHLLSMSRGMSQQAAISHPQYFPTNPLFPSASAHSLGVSRQQPYSRPFIEHQLAQGRMLGAHPGLTFASQEGQGQKGSLLDTPAPREKPPRPVESKGGGFLQEILAADSSPQLNTTFSLPHGHTPPRSRRDGGSPVEKARKLVQDLSNLEDETAESVWHDHKKPSRTRLPVDEPAPLESYLKRVRDPNTTPYSKLIKSKRSHSSSPSKASTSKDAPVSNKFDDAHSVLRSVLTQRQAFETNLDLLLRSRQDVDVYTMLGMAGADSSEVSRIQKMVEKRISAIRNEVMREVEWDMQHGVSKQPQPSTSDGKKGTRGQTGKPGVGFGSGAPRMSRIDTGLRKSNPLSETVTVSSKGKKPAKAKPAPKVPKSKIPYENEEAMTRLYGKADYQKGRTTVRDPYLHYQNQAKPRTSRIPSPKRADSYMDVKSSKIQTQPSAAMGGQYYDVEAVSGAPRQFYFTPTTGYVPLGATSGAPVPGQLVPMAVPLGKPRMDPGLALGAQTLPFSVPPSSSTPIRPVVTAATNVAMVAMTAGDEMQGEQLPELGKQVLPAVDIDSITPASTPRGSDIQISGPEMSRNAGYAETFHNQDSEEEGRDTDRTLTEDMSDEEQLGTGISLPGYHQPTPARASARTASPDRASQNTRFQGSKAQLREEGHVPWEERCDELAEDLRRRDILQNRAKYWLEQELMARLLLQMYPALSAAEQQQAEQAEAADKSESIPDDESLIIGDTIGREGLQLFVDAGQPVDNKLVNALVKEVIAEKVNGMLSRQREGEMATAAGISRTKAGGGGEAVAEEIEYEPEYVQPARQPDRIPTPQPTPRTSPVPGFVSQRPAPATPPLTPPPLSPKQPVQEEMEVRQEVGPVAAEVQPAPLQYQPAMVESDTEVSASVDISEELRALDDKLKPAQTFAAALVSQPQHDVVTPTATPPPSPPPQPQERPREKTPPPSPPPPRPEVEPPPPAPSSPKKEAETKPKSPQPWGNPDSPVPELNPDYEEDARLQHTQPKPLLMSVGVGPGPQAEERRSPSPQRQPTLSSDQSEFDSYSSPSSQSDTNNDNISEGQWLVSRSEGQVAGFPLEEGVQRMAMEAVRKVDISTASTLRDTEDIEPDDTDVSRSEGEFQHKGDGNPETDPVLALMLQMQRQPGGFRQYNMPAEHVQHVLNTTGRSAGEVAMNGQGQEVMTHKSLGEMSEGQVLPGGRGVTVVTPKRVESRPAEQYLSSNGEERAAYQPRTQSPPTRDKGRSSPSDHRALNKHRPKSPSGARGRQQQYQPVSSGLPPTMTQGRRPLKSALVRNSSEDYRHSKDSEPDSDRRGPPTEYGTRTFTPDQLNMDALLQSGSYVNVSRSMGSSGRQGTKKSVEFDLSGTYEMSRRDSWRGSDDYTERSSDHLSGTGRSLGLRYSFDESGSDTGDGYRMRMSVTIPTTDAADGESDISEIDISESTGK